MARNEIRHKAEWGKTQVTMSEAETVRAVMATKISIVSNATLADGPTLLRLVPHWLRVFGSRLDEIILVVDSEPLIGRIAELQRGQSTQGRMKEAIQSLEVSDARVRFVSLESIKPTALQRRWFGRARPVRCQAGTPILAFIAAIDQARCDIVLRCDSDMLFCENGWLDEAIQSLEEGVDVYEPPHLHLGVEREVSSRAFMIAKQSFYGHLPLRNLRLDVLRVLHRMSKGRPPWLALEQMMTSSVAKGQLFHKVGRNTDLGFSLHGLKRAWIGSPWFDEVIRFVESGEVPSQQQRCWDFVPEYWGIEVH